MKSILYWLWITHYLFSKFLTHRQIGSNFIKHHEHLPHCISLELQAQPNRMKRRVQNITRRGERKQKTTKQREGGEVGGFWHNSNISRVMQPQLREYN